MNDTYGCTLAALVLCYVPLHAEFRLGIENISDEFITYLSPDKPLTIGLITNQTGKDQKGRSNIAILREKGIIIKYLFAPEHGIAGTVAAGKTVHNGYDEQHAIPIVSLYRDDEGKKICDACMQELEALFFDIQDSGMRHYTYISIAFIERSSYMIAVINARTNYQILIITSFLLNIAWSPLTHTSTTITSKEQLDNIISRNRPVVAKFEATWCGPCQVAKKPFEEVASESELTDAQFVTIDIDKNQDIATTYSVSSIPTILFIVEGNVVHQETGMPSAKAFKDAIRSKTQALLSPASIQKTPDVQRVSDTPQPPSAEKASFISTVFKSIMVLVQSIITLVQSVINAILNIVSKFITSIKNLF